jgi:uncharacterized lipoprotein YmbA
MADSRDADLFPDVCNPESVRGINDRCLVRTQEGQRIVVVSGVTVAHYAVGDGMAEAYAMVNLVEQGWCDQNDVAQAFGCSVRKQIYRSLLCGQPSLVFAVGVPGLTTRPRRD